MVKIVSDSTCDLSPELVNRYDIDILPLHILLGEKEYKDGKNITPDEIFAWSDAHKTTPKTSAPSLVDAIMLKKKGKLSVFQYHQVCQLPEMLCVLLLMSWKPPIL